MSEKFSLKIDPLQGVRAVFMRRGYTPFCKGVSCQSNDKGYINGLSMVRQLINSPLPPLQPLPYYLLPPTPYTDYKFTPSHPPIINLINPPTLPPHYREVGRGDCNNNLLTLEYIGGKGGGGEGILSHPHERFI